MSDTKYKILIAVIVILMIIFLADTGGRVYSYFTTHRVFFGMQNEAGEIHQETQYNINPTDIARIVVPGIIRICFMAVVLFLIKKDWAFRKAHSDNHSDSL